MTQKKFSILAGVGAKIGDSYNRTFQSAQKTALELGKSYEKTNKQLSVTRDVIKYRKTLDKLKLKQKQAGGSSKKLAAGIKEVAERYSKAKQQARAYGFQISDIIQQEKRLEKQLARTHKARQRRDKANRAKNRLRGMQSAAVGVAGLGYAMSRAGSNAAKFDTSGVFLETVINAKSKEAATEKAKRHALRFSRKNIATEIEVLEIEYALNSAGFDSKLATFSSEITSKVSKVTKGTSGKVGEIIGIVYNNLGESIEGRSEEKITRIGDVLTQTQFKFQIRDFDQLGESFKQGSKAAIKYNVDLVQTSAVLGQLNNAGIMGGAGGTAFNAILRQMTKGAKEFNFEIIRNEKGKMDLIKTLGNLKESVSIYDDVDERADALQKAYGDEGSAVAILIDQYDKLKKNYKSVKDDSRGVTERSYQKLLASSAGQMAIYKNSTRQIGIVFANTLLPSFNAVLKPISAFAGWVAEGIQKFPVIGRIIGAVAVGIGVFATVIGVVTAAQWAWNAALAANPIGLIVAGVIAASVAVYTLFENWDSVVTSFKNGWSWFSKKFPVIGKIIELAFLPLKWVIKGVSWLWDKVFGDDEETKTDDKDENKIGSTIKNSSLGKTLESESNVVELKTNKTVLNKTVVNPMTTAKVLPFKPVEQSSDQKHQVNKVLSTASASNQNNQVIHNKIDAPITIHAAPGMNESEIAKQVRDELDARTREQEAEQRGVLHDGINAA